MFSPTDRNRDGGGLPASRIELNLVSDPGLSATETDENAQDVFLLSTPLCRGRVRLECDGGLIFDGDVRPGMLRIVSPGERVRVIRRSAAEAAVIAIPDARFREIAGQHEHACRPDALSMVDPVLDADPHVERLGSSLLAVADVDPGQRALFVEGFSTGPATGSLCGGQVLD